MYILPLSQATGFTSFRCSRKDKKVFIIAERAQAKKVKATHKMGFDGGSDGRGTSGSGESREPVRKRVTFA